MLFFQEKETPLHMASKVKGGEKVVDVLIKSGVDPDAVIQVAIFLRSDFVEFCCSGEMIC